MARLNQLTQMNPVSNFQTAQSNALINQQRQQQIDREASTAPVRNQLEQLGLQQKQTAFDRDEVEFGRSEGIREFKLMNQVATALKELPFEQRLASLQKISGNLKAQGLDVSSYTPDDLSDTELDQAIVETQSLLGNQDAQSRQLKQAQLEGVQASTELKKEQTKQVQTGGNVKPTSSKQDFETYKTLKARAAKTGDPIDMELADKFGVQAGFDRLSPQELADIEVDKTSKKELVKQAATASKEAFDSLKGVRRTIANMTDAISTLNRGAETGPIISRLPSFRQAAIELDNIKGRMGLDVVGATTFGALSESELKFALDVALPTSLEPAALKTWLTRKKEAQTKLADELRKAASFLGTPGNTIAGYLKIQEEDTAKKVKTKAETFAKYGIE